MINWETSGAGMRLNEVMAVLADLRAVSCQFWVAGGWGVDALVGRQTRPHRDLDLAVDAEHETAAVTVLSLLGYAVETDWRPVRVELVAPNRGWVDLHPVAFDPTGQGRQADLAGGSVQQGRDGEAEPGIKSAARAVDRDEVGDAKWAGWLGNQRQTDACGWEGNREWDDGGVQVKLRAWGETDARLESPARQNLGVLWRSHRARRLVAGGVGRCPPSSWGAGGRRGDMPRGRTLSPARWPLRRRRAVQKTGLRRKPNVQRDKPPRP